MKQLYWITALFALSASAFSTHAAALKIGDPAPKLQVSKWVQGEPVKEFEKGKAYIVEFWATWCGPCRVSIPHLNDIHTKFKDKGLIVIGQDVLERDVTKVAPFVKEMGDKMSYRVALDQVAADASPNEGQMAKTWMQAAGIEGIPAAFLIDKEGKIAWIGHPMELEDAVIEQVLSGTFDSKKAAAEHEKEKQSQEQLMKLSQELNTNFKNKDWDKALTNVAEIDKLLPEKQKLGLSMVRVKILLAKGDNEGASKLAQELSDAHKDDARLQNGLAWALSTEENGKVPNLELAQKLATRANEVAKGQDPSVLDTLAHINFRQGNKDKAIELETQAVKLAEGDIKDELQKNLDSFKQGKLPKPETAQP